MKVFPFASVTFIILVSSVYCSSQDLPQSIEKCTAIHKSIYDNATTIFAQVETLDNESTSKHIIYIEKHTLSKTRNIKKDLKRYNRFLKKCKNKEHMQINSRPRQKRRSVTKHTKKEKHRHRHKHRHKHRHRHKTNKQIDIDTHTDIYIDIDIDTHRHTN